MSVHGKTSDADITYEISGQRKLHIITIWGLYYNDTTDVTVTCMDASGHARQKSLSITTGEAPDPSRMPQISCSYDEERFSEIAPGLTFCATIGSYHFAVDKYGDVRWYYSDPAGLGDSGITFNDQQHLLVLTPKTSSAATNSFSMMEMDLMGRKYNEYFIDGSFHHEVKLMENGHILCAASGQGKSTINDCIVELDPDTGDVVREWNIDEILTMVLTCLLILCGDTLLFQRRTGVSSTPTGSTITAFFIVIRMIASSFPAAIEAWLLRSTPQLRR